MNKGSPELDQAQQTVVINNAALESAMNRLAKDVEETIQPIWNLVFFIKRHYKPLAIGVIGLSAVGLAVMLKRRQALPHL